MKMSDVLIIGGGPAGVTAALYTARANFKTTIICKDHGALGKADKVENFYGHLEIGGQALVEIGLAQAKNMGADVISGEVVGIYATDNHTIIVETTSGKQFEAKTVMLATGATRKTPRIKGLADLEGRGVSYCAVCDGFFHRGKHVAVLGHGEYALHEVADLLPLAHAVTVLTNGEDALVEFPENVIVRAEKIEEVVAVKSMLGAVLGGVRLDGGDTLTLSGLFVAVGIAGGTELARKIGAVVDGGSVVVDNRMSTSVPGLWAAGDCTGGLKQIAKAVYEGAEAGTDIVRYLREGIK